MVQESRDRPACSSAPGPDPCGASRDQQQQEPEQVPILTGPEEQVPLLAGPDHEDASAAAKLVDTVSIWTTWME